MQLIDAEYEAFKLWRPAGHPPGLEWNEIRIPDGSIDGIPSKATYGEYPLFLPAGAELPRTTRLLFEYGKSAKGCFNSEQLLKKWRKRTRGKSRDQIRSIFYNYLSFGDKLGPRHLQRVMNEVFHADLSGEEVRVLFRKVGLKTCSKCSSQR